MKRIACLALLLCLLLTSCASSGGDLNIYTTEPRPDALVTDVTTVVDAEESYVIKTHDIPDELREYVPGYTYQSSDDDNDKILCRYVNTKTVSGDYLYFSSHIGEGPGRIAQVKRINLKTGEISGLCFDPVCTHDSLRCDLCFQDISNIQIFGRYLAIYARMSMGGTSKAYLYDTATGEVRKEIFNRDGNTMLSTYFGCIGDNLYSSVTVRTDNPNSTGDRDKTIYDEQIWEYNMPTGNSRKVLSFVNTTNTGGLITTFNGRLYYYDEYSQTRSMLPDGSDDRSEPGIGVFDYYSADVSWYIRYNPSVIQTIDMKTGIISDIINVKNIMAYCATNNYIYYSVKKTSFSDEIHAELWRCNNDGSDPKKLLDSEFSLSRLYIHGNYLYLSGNSGNGAQAKSVLVRMHVETGEILYLD